MTTPKPYSNSWLGICGATMALLRDAEGRELGHTIETPNAIAHAMANNPNVHTALGRFGDVYTRETYKD